MKKRLQILAGSLISVALLYIVFRGTEWGAVWSALRQAHWGWMLACEAVIVLSFFLRVQRWRYIVWTVKQVPYRDLFHATQLGFLGNFVLPARAGEFIRAIALSRVSGLAFSKCFAFVALDRMTDLFGLAAVMMVAAAAFTPEQAITLPADLYAEPIPPTMIRSAAIVTLLVLAGILASFVFFYLNLSLAVRIHRAIVGRISARLCERLEGMIVQFGEGMHVFRSLRDLSRAIAYSVLTWLILTLSYYCIIRALDLPCPWYTAFVMVSLLSAAISVPSSPAFVGPFHIAIVGALWITWPPIQDDLDRARAVALCGHLLHTIPVIVVGLFSMYASQINIASLQQEQPPDSGEEHL